MKTKIELLEEFAKKLAKEVPQENFDMTSWISDSKFTSRVISKIKDFFKLSPKECGTAGCAIGWWPALMGNKGLKLEATIDAYNSVDIMPVYKGESSYYAIAKYFGMSDNEAEWLFGPDSYLNEYPNIQSDKLTPKIVSKRILEFCKNVKKGLRLKDIDSDEFDTPIDWNESWEDWEFEEDQDDYGDEDPYDSDLDCDEAA